MVALIEQELKSKDKELQDLLDELQVDKAPENIEKVNANKLEQEILQKLLIRQKHSNQKKASEVENGLLIFAAAIFGALTFLVVYLITGTNAVTGTWEQVGGEMAVLVLLLIMTTMSITLYYQHYRSQS
jgi:cytochrome c-type biogenesis protein CcmH/NrfG